MMADIDHYFPDHILDDLERFLSHGSATERRAVIAALAVVHDCAKDARRLRPLPTVHVVDNASGKTEFKIYSFGRHETILACPGGDLSFRVIYFGPGLDYGSRRRLLEGDLKSLWS